MNLALLVLRLVVGLGFAAHGAQKLFGAFGGGGIAATGGFFEQVGLRPGKRHALAAGAAEFAGGLLIALGLLTPFAAAALIGVMTAAVLTVHGRNGFFVTNNGFEYNLTLAAAVFALAGVGAGHWSLDHAFGLDLMSTGWALGALVVGVLGGIGAVMSGRLAGARSADPGRPHTA
ncbi:MAG: putative oxidoreductase [Solirubrobacteraceae bacterium]|jgi:putative oxidoreductase|nr:putative oxidoreductase [Solirubrobacteraceae bacterium]